MKVYSPTARKKSLKPEKSSLSTILFFLLCLFMLSGTAKSAGAYEVIVDNSDVTGSKNTFGFWMKNSGRWDEDANGNAYGNTHHESDHRNPKNVRWYPILNQQGDYDVYVRWVSNANYDESARYKVYFENATDNDTVRVDQTEDGSSWHLLGRWYFEATNREHVRLVMGDGPKLSADAVRFVLVASTTTSTTSTSTTSSTSSTTSSSTTSSTTTSTSSSSTTSSSSSSTTSSTTTVGIDACGLNWIETSPGGGTYDETGFPLVLGNGTIQQTWTITFINTQWVEVSGDTVGVTNGTFLTWWNRTAGGTDIAPVNPATGTPYFTLSKKGWNDSGTVPPFLWNGGDSLTFTTNVPCAGPTTSSTSTTSSTTSTTSSSTTSTSTSTTTSSSSTTTTTSTSSTTSVPAWVTNELTAHTMSEFSSLPINLVTAVTPQVMITASNDNQFFFKAYDDYSDLDDDGLVDTTYKPNVTYYGYFDSFKCYDYDTVAERFEPAAVAGETYFMQGTVSSFTPGSGQMTMNVTILQGSIGLGPYNNWTVTNLSTGATGASTTSNSLSNAGTKTFETTAEDWISVGDTVMVSIEIPSYCDGANINYWSGNFLNWASMTRIDTIRKILFGGHRRVDTAVDTVLERSYLPHDAHSFAKHYEGSDLGLLTPFVEGVDFTLNNGDARIDGITICNTTDVNGTTYSEDVTDPPLIKVAKGNYTLWAGNERWQCTWASGAPFDNRSANNSNTPAVSGIYSYSSSPNYSQGLGEKNYVARVQVCVAGLLGEEKCKQYPDGNYKPIGLLQVYGDDNQLHFGMIAGSYNKHVSGGVLIRNIGSMNDEINVATNGTFSKVAATAGGAIGHPYNGAEGLINAWSLFRITGYSHASGNGTYRDNSGDNCDWGLSAFADVSGENECRNWGNPFSEIYFQAIRYFSDGGVTGTYRSNSSTGITGLPTPMPWTDPLDTTNYCARLNIVNFNSSIASYDWDELDHPSYGVTTVWDTNDLPGDDTTGAMTDVVGEGEGIHGGTYFVGETNIEDQSDGEDQLCTAKVIANLGDVGGICPESPRLQGSYRIAGLAYYAHIADVRSDSLTGGRALDGMQTIDTFSVSAAPAVPQIGIPHPLTSGNAVLILPACRNQDLSPEGNCALVDFKIVSQVINDGTGIGTGRFYINWEDSEQGGDYDQDMWGLLDYEINGNTNVLKITTDVIAESTSYDMGFGYILSGTTQDGFHVHSGIQGFTYDDPGAIIVGGDCAAGCTVGNGPSTIQYSLGASTSELLENPLYYAAKWGGFEDRNGNNVPDLDSEWDQVDENGNPVPDGIPDNYFLAHNPSQLETALNRVFLAILQRTSSGTAAAVVSNNVRGEGALYQAYYEPLKQDSLGNKADWVGTLHAMWLDSYGFMREDNGDGALGDYDEDRVIETYFDDAENRTRVRRWYSSDPDTFTPDSFVTIELAALTPIWNAREQLYYRTLTDNDLKTQRAYSTTAANGRYITTWIDRDRDGVVDTGEHIDFTETAIDDVNYGWFDLQTEAETDGLVNYLRGMEIAGYRSRKVDYDADGTTEVMRLGDIINSTPTIVGRPQESFDLLYRDFSYGAFRRQYANRRNVLYVGGNDGLLHAFNAGFFDAATTSFKVTGKKHDGTDAAEHPLGSEIWAYAPYNLLSHLKWLKETDYSHVFYVDGKPRVFDAKIFTDDDDHPGGWGTLLVVGMRLGGGKMTVDTGLDGLAGNDWNGDTVDDLDLQSAYIIFDITNPETPPSLLAEIPLPDDSFTMVYPTPMTFKDQISALDDNSWYLVFGSGPHNLSTAASSSTAKLYVLDLRELTTPGITSLAPTGCAIETIGSSLEVIKCDTATAGMFVGDPVSVDWDLDYKADMVYFGLVGDATANTGKMMRFAVDEYSEPNLWDTPTVLFETSQPVTAAAAPGVDDKDPANHWVFFETGRLYAQADESSTATQSIYGIKDSYDPSDRAGTNGAVAAADLVDVTHVLVGTNGDLINPPIGITTFDDLENVIDSSKAGWKLDIDMISGTAGADPATRGLSQPALLGGILFSSVYQPSVDPCASEGFSRLYGQYFKTGTPLPEPSVFGTNIIYDAITGEEMEVAQPYINLGRGQATSPAIHSGSGTGGTEISVFTQLSTGTIFRQEAQTKDDVRSGKQSWKQR